MQQIPPERWRAVAAALRQQHQASLAWLPDPAPANPYNWYLLVAEDLEGGAPDKSWDYYMVFSTAAALLSLPARRAFSEEILAAFALLAARPKDTPSHHALPPMLIGVFEQYLTPEDGWVLPWLLPFTAARADNIDSAVEADRRAALSLLGLVGDPRDPRVTEPLLAALRGRAKANAGVAATSLGELGVEEAAGPLIAWLRRSRNQVFVQALGLLRAQEALEPLVAILRDRRPPPPLFASIAAALARIGGTQTEQALRPYLEHPGVGHIAAIALSRLGDEGQVEAIALAAAHPEEPNWEAARRLVELGDPRGLAAMQSMYTRRINGWRQEPSWPVDRAVTLRDLSRWGTLADIPLLEWVRGYDFDLTDQGWTLAEEAERAIGRIQIRHRARPHL